MINEAFPWLELSNQRLFESARGTKIVLMTYYHGTANDNIVDMILPPAITGCISEVGRKKNLNKVFFTTSYRSAMIYAKRAANQYGGTPRVLAVNPVGDIVCLNQNQGTEVYYSDACKVLTTSH